MKKFILAAYIFFCTGGTYAQVKVCNHPMVGCWCIERIDTLVAELDFNRPLTLPVNPYSIKWRMPVIKPDTLRATLLITRNRMRMAYSYEGYVVIRQRDTVYLDDKKRLIKPPVKVWGVEINNGKINHQ